MDEATFRMLLNLEISAIGRSVIFDVASDLSSLANAQQAQNAANILSARADLTAANAMLAQRAAATDLTSGLQHAASLAMARSSVEAEANARVQASTTASAAEQILATQRLVASLDTAAAARERLANAAILNNRAVAESDLATAQAAEAASAAQVAATERRAEALRVSGLLIGGATLLAAGALAEATAKAAEFQTSLLMVQGNTGATAGEIAGLHDKILQLASATGQSTDQLANGFRRAYDLSQNATVATAVLVSANKDAIGTGADLVTTANALAQIMHVYKLDLLDAGSATDQMSQAQQRAASMMGLMQVAANNSNLTLEQFAKSFAIVGSWAASVGVPANEAAAAFAAITKDTGNAARAGTQVIDMFQHIINPSRAAAEEIKRISQLSGVDLTKDFNSTGLAAKHITGILADVKQAFTNLGYSEEQQNGEMLRMIPNLRGGVGAFLLLNSANGDYVKILGATADAEKSATIVTDQYQRVIDSAAGKFNILKGAVEATVVKLGEAYLPVAGRVLDQLTPMVLGLGDWAAANRDLITTVGPLAIEIGAAASAALLLGAAVSALALFTPVGFAVAVAVGAASAAFIALNNNWLGLRDRGNELVGTINSVKQAIAENNSRTDDQVESFKRLATAQGAVADGYVGLPGHAAEWVRVSADLVYWNEQTATTAEKAARAAGAVADGYLGAANDSKNWIRATEGFIGPLQTANNGLKTMEITLGAVSGAGGDYVASVNADASAVSGLAQELANLTAEQEKAASALFGTAGNIVDTLVATDPAAVAAAASVAGLQDKLNGLRDAEANAAGAASGGGGVNQALKGMQEQSKDLTAEIQKANQALRDLATPNLPGMQAADDKIFQMGQKQKKLEDTKLNMELGGAKDNSPAMKAIDAQIKREQELISLAENHKSLKYDLELRKIKEAVDGVKQVMTFDDVIKQIKETKDHLATWTAEEEALKAKIADTEETVRGGSSARHSYTAEIRATSDALLEAKQREKDIDDALKATAQWNLAAAGSTTQFGINLANFAVGITADVKFIQDALASGEVSVANAGRAKMNIDEAIAKWRIANPNAPLPPELAALGGSPLITGAPTSQPVNPYREPRGAATYHTTVNVHPGAIAVTGNADAATNDSMHRIFTDVFGELDSSMESHFRNQNVRKRTLAGAQ